MNRLKREKQKGNQTRLTPMNQRKRLRQGQQTRDTNGFRTKHGQAVGAGALKELGHRVQRLATQIHQRGGSTRHLATGRAQARKPTGAGVLGAKYTVFWDVVQGFLHFCPLNTEKNGQFQWTPPVNCNCSRRKSVTPV